MEPKHIINVHQHLRHGQNIEERIKLWRSCNVRKTCVLAFPTRFRTRGRFDNDDTLPWLNKYPKDLVGMGYIDSGKNPDPPEKVDELKEQGFAGLKFIYSHYPYNHEKYFPIYDRAEKLEMPILFHTNFLSVASDDKEYGTDCNNYRPILLDKIARSFPKLKIIATHLRNEEGRTYMMAHPNIYSDFCASAELRTLQLLSPPIPNANMADPQENPALRLFTKLCFATDSPEPPRWIEISNRIMDKLCIPQETREMYYWKNACKIFGWDESDL